jgi:hypothetical protein
MAGNFVNLLLAVVTWILIIIVYRLHFHPLAKVPGPKIAAITWLYQTYYSLVGGSRFYLQIEHLHQTYGTVSLDMCLTEAFSPDHVPVRPHCSYHA